MPAGVNDEKQIISYLLGELSETECARIEERLLRDAEYLETVRAVEDDLIDEYNRGELPAHERRRVEDYFAASPLKRKKITFARELSNLLDETSVAKAAGRPRRPAAWWAALWAPLSSPRPALQLAIVTLAVAFAALSLWLLVDRRRVHSDVARLESEQHEGRRREDTLQQEIAAERVRRDGLARELEGEREHRLRVEEQVQQLRRESERADLPQKGAARQSAPTLSSAVATFVLTPGLTRGSDEPTRLVIPSGVRLMRLQLDLEAGDEYRSYRAELRTTGGNLVWSRDLSASRKAGAGRPVILSLPTGLLASGEYELTLRGGAGERRFEDIGYYYFSILKR